MSRKHIVMLVWVLGAISAIITIVTYLGGFWPKNPSIDVTSAATGGRHEFFLGEKLFFRLEGVAQAGSVLWIFDEETVRLGGLLADYSFQSKTSGQAMGTSVRTVDAIVKPGYRHVGVSVNIVNRRFPRASLAIRDGIPTFVIDGSGFKIADPSVAKYDGTISSTFMKLKATSDVSGHLATYVPIANAGKQLDRFALWNEKALISFDAIDANGVKTTIQHPLALLPQSLDK